MGQQIERFLAAQSGAPEDDDQAAVTYADLAASARVDDAEHLDLGRWGRGVALSVIRWLLALPESVLRRRRLEPALSLTLCGGEDVEQRWRLVAELDVRLGHAALLARFRSARRRRKIDSSYTRVSTPTSRAAAISRATSSLRGIASR